MFDDAPRLVRVAGRAAWHIYHQRHRVSTGTPDRAEAERALAEYRAGLTREAAPTASIAGILALYLQDRTDAGIPGLERLKWAHKPLVRFWGDRPVSAITAAESRRYSRFRADTGVSTGTARTEMQALTAALAWALRPPRRFITEMPEIVLPPRAQPRERWLTEDEARRLIEGASAHRVRLFILLALHTAARAGAILSLTWDRVDLDGRLIDYREPGRAQTRKGRARAPINDTLHPALVEAKAAAVSDYVIEWAGGRIASIKNGFHQATVRAGLPGVTPHTLRHTAATWMVQRGVPIWEVSGLLGHSSPRMVEDTYAHHSPEHLRRATRALG